MIIFSLLDKPWLFRDLFRGMHHYLDLPFVWLKVFLGSARNIVSTFPSLLEFYCTSPEPLLLFLGKARCSGLSLLFQNRDGKDRYRNAFYQDDTSLFVRPSYHEQHPLAHGEVERVPIDLGFADFQDDYQAYHRSCGGQTQHEVGFVLDAAPSHVDAQHDTFLDQSKQNNTPLKSIFPGLSCLGVLASSRSNIVKADNKDYA